MGAPVGLAVGQNKVGYSDIHGSVVGQDDRMIAVGQDEDLGIAKVTITGRRSILEQVWRLRLGLGLGLEQFVSVD